MQENGVLGQLNNNQIEIQDFWAVLYHLKGVVCNRGGGMWQGVGACGRAGGNYPWPPAPSLCPYPLEKSQCHMDLFHTQNNHVRLDFFQILNFFWIPQRLLKNSHISPVKTPIRILWKLSKFDTALANVWNV